MVYDLKQKKMDFFKNKFKKTKKLSIKFDFKTKKKYPKILNYKLKY